MTGVEKMWQALHVVLLFKKNGTPNSDASEAERRKNLRALLSPRLEEKLPKLIWA